MNEKAPPPPHERTTTAAYIADLAGSLAQMARQHGMTTLSYLLDMAKLEAENVKGVDGPRH